MTSLYPTAPFEAARIQALEGLGIVTQLGFVRDNNQYLLNCGVPDTEGWLGSGLCEVTWQPQTGMPSLEINVKIPAILVGGFRIPTLGKTGQEYTDVITQPFNGINIKATFGVTSLVIIKEEIDERTEYPYAAISSHDGHKNAAMHTIIGAVASKLEQSKN